MATSNAFNEKVEACIAALLREEYPHMKTSSINVIASATANSTAEHAKDRFRVDCKGVRPLQLLDLPRELRDQIYEKAVTPSLLGAISIGVDQGETFSTGVHILGNRFDKNSGKQPNITRVCRQMRRETLPIIYRRNHFIASLETTAFGSNLFGVEKPVIVFSKWLEAIGPDNIKDLRRLVVIRRSNGRQRYTAEVMLTWEEFFEREGVTMNSETEIEMITQSIDRLTALPG